MNAGIKRRAAVTNVDDPKSLGRIRVRLVAFGDGDRLNETPWCWPCTPLAGDGYGFFCLPQVGDEVWVEPTADGGWVWVGFYWSGRRAKPSEGNADVRVLRTPAGHQIKLDESGDLEITHANGNVVALRGSGDIDVTVSGACNITSDGKTIVNAEKIELNGATGKVVTTDCLCSYTGAPHTQGSNTVKAEGPF